jgi:hypothetical protein
MVYNSQGLVDIEILEQDEEYILEYVKKQMVIELAMKLWKDGQIKFSTFDPRLPLDTEGLSEEQIKMLSEKRKHLIHTNSVELSLKLDIKEY